MSDKIGHHATLPYISQLKDRLMSPLKRAYRKRWYDNMIERTRGEWQGLILAEWVGLSEHGKMLVRRFNKRMRWMQNARDGRPIFSKKT